MTRVKLYRPSVALKPKSTGHLYIPSLSTAQISSTSTIDTPDITTDMVSQLFLALGTWLMPWLLRLFQITGYGALPCVWAETLLFWMLGLDASTLFRMFPRADSFPADYPPGMGYAFALILISWIPGFVRSDRRYNGSGSLGTLLRPLTSRCSPPVEYFVVFARVWLVTAWANMTMAQFAMDHLILPCSLKMACMYFIL